MLDPITKQWRANISCRRCRYRHPAEWSCAVAAAHAADQRADRGDVPNGVEPAPMTLTNSELQTAIDYAVEQSRRLGTDNPARASMRAHLDNLLAIQVVRAKGE